MEKDKKSIEYMEEILDKHARNKAYRRKCLLGCLYLLIKSIIMFFLGIFICAFIKFLYCN